MDTLHFCCETLVSLSLSEIQSHVCIVSLNLWFCCVKVYGSSKWTYISAYSAIKLANTQRTNGYPASRWSGHLICFYVQMTRDKFWQKVLNVRASFFSPFTLVFWGSFAKLSKATISFVMSVCPFVRPSLCLSVRMEQLFFHRTGFHEIWYLNICRKPVKKLQLEGCLTVHLPHEIMWNVNLMQQGNFIDIFLARYVSGTYAHHHEH